MTPALRSIPVVTTAPRGGDVERIQLFVAVGKVVFVGKSVRSAIEARFVVDGGPHNGIGSSRGQGCSDRECESVQKGKLQALQKVESVLTVGKVGHAVRAAVALSGIRMVLLLCI